MPSPNTDAQTVSPEPIRKPGFWKFLLLLFLAPRAALLCAREHAIWFRGILYLILFICLTAGILTGNEKDDIAEQCDAAQTLLLKHVASVTLADSGTITWSLTDPVPAPGTHVSNRGVRLTFAPPDTPPNHTELEQSHDRLGFIIAPNTCLFWRRYENTSQLLMMDLAKHLLFKENIRRLGTPTDHGYTLDATAIRTILRLAYPAALVTAFNRWVLEYAVLVLTCLCIFFFTTVFFRTVSKTSFGAALASHIACLLPPLILTMFLAASRLFPPQSGIYTTAFTVFFVVYLIVLFLDRSVSIVLRSSGDAPKETP